MALSLEFWSSRRPNTLARSQQNTENDALKKRTDTFFEIACPKLLPGPLQARCAEAPRLSGRCWGACAQLDPAKEP